MQGADSQIVSPRGICPEPSLPTKPVSRLLPRERPRIQPVRPQKGPDLRPGVESLERWLDLNA
jgi:hypothetical protein